MAHLNADFYSKNRDNLLRKMAPNSALLLAGNSELLRTSDVPYPFRQSNNLLYLTGYDQPDAYLLMSSGQTRLYIKKLHPFMQVWEGRANQTQQISKTSGITDIKEYAQLDEIFNDLGQPDRLYLDIPDASTAQIAAWRLQEEVKQRQPDTQLDAINPLINDLRLIKSPVELECIRAAVEATQRAIEHCRALIKPTVSERQIAAEFINYCSTQGLEQAFPPIISFGKNSCIIHHMPDDTLWQTGDLVLFDVGAEFEGYAADISRTILPAAPTARQQQVYEAVERVQAAAMKLMRPGVKFDDFEAQAAQLMAQELVGLGLFKSIEAANQPEGDLQWPAYRRYFNHYISHYMGLDAHDVGPRQAQFAAGMVLTCEPGIYIAEEGIGVRVEDDILITAAKNEQLTAVPADQ